MRKLAALAVGVMLLASPVLAQRTPSSQNGKATPGDVAKIQSNGSTTSAGNTLGDPNGKGVNPFAVYDRGADGVCFRTGPVSAPHNAFCFGHKADGTPLITVDSLGGMAAKQLRCRINGVEGPCFGTTGGGGGGAVGALALNAGGCLALHSGGCLGLHQ